jgi:hypothetical protein
METIPKVSLWSMEWIGRSIGGSVEFFSRAVFFPTVEAKTGLTGFPNRSDRFRPVGCREGFLSKEVSVAPWLHLFRCGKALEVFWSLGSFWTKSVWPVSPACVRLSPTEAVWPVSQTCLTGLGCQQPCRVCFRCVCDVAVGWVLLLGSVALQWLRELGKRGLRRCMSEIGFIGRILE